MGSGTGTHLQVLDTCHTSFSFDALSVLSCVKFECEVCAASAVFAVRLGCVVWSGELVVLLSERRGRLGCGTLKMGGAAGAN